MLMNESAEKKILSIFEGDICEEAIITVRKIKRRYWWKNYKYVHHLYLLDSPLISAKQQPRQGQEETRMILVNIKDDWASPVEMIQKIRSIGLELPNKFQADVFLNDHSHHRHNILAMLDATIVIDKKGDFSFVPYIRQNETGRMLMMLLSSKDIRFCYDVLCRATNNF